MRIDDLLPDGPADRHALVVLNRSSPRQVFELLEATFPDDSVAVTESSSADAGDDVVALVVGDDVVATSPLSDLGEHLLFVNSDLFVTGSRAVDAVELPDVLAGLEGVPFRLRGFPESNREKLVLALLSRAIERRALRADAGTLRTGFQRLSRLDDERGTADVYERLADGGVDVHLYGVPDALPAPERYDVVHAGRSRPFRRAWFVIQRPNGPGEPADPDEGAGDAVDAPGPSALLALEEEPGSWRGFWTFDADRVRDLDRFVRRRL